MKKIIIIPARLGSKRLTSKVLLDLKGKTLIQRVFENSLKANVNDVYIATDSEIIKNASISFTNNVILTSDKHLTGSDRVAEASENIECDIVVNVQADEPFIKSSTINSLLNCFLDKKVNMASAMYSIKDKKVLNNPNEVKVSVDNEGNALFFSRYPSLRVKSNWIKNKIDHNNNYFIHKGIYAFRKEFLLKFFKMERTYFEKVESLEQLRVLESGYKIKMIKVEDESIGIDTIEDYRKALKKL
tara:strand:+ start:714 stop:1445 length:732 start_codon:yes stop_codon:yes gene_type:complete